MVPNVQEPHYYKDLAIALADFKITGASTVRWPKDGRGRDCMYEWRISDAWTPATQATPSLSALGRLLIPQQTPERPSAFVASSPSRSIFMDGRQLRFQVPFLTIVRRLARGKRLSAANFRRTFFLTCEFLPPTRLPLRRA